jgi:CNT family concentrative nucleoside transporter
VERIVSFFGLFVMIFCAWLLSPHKKKIPWRVIIGGLTLQFIIAFLMLKTSWGNIVFEDVNNGVKWLLNLVELKTLFLFSPIPNPPDYAPIPFGVNLVIKIFVTIIFFSAMISVFYYYGLIQLLLKLLAKVMQVVLNTSGAETLASAANVFVGQTEAPLIIKHYLPSMTKSEMMSVLTGGFATIAGSVFAIYASQPGVKAGNLLIASVISAPAALLIAKVMLPETEEPKTKGKVDIEIKLEASNVIHALTKGAADGAKLAFNVVAMLIAFVAVISVLDAALIVITSSINPDYETSISDVFGWFFWPFAWLMGVESKDCAHVGELLGLKMVLNELLAYQRFGEWNQPESGIELSERSKTIVQFALCGFANFASIGVQIGGISPMCPEREGEIAKLGFRAMLGGTLAAYMTACIAGVLI